MTFRTWVTPLTAATFALVAASGLLLFFHLAPGATRALHEWVGWALAAAVALHLVLNRRSLRGHLRRPAMPLLLALAAVLTLGQLFLPAGSPPFAGMRALAQAAEPRTLRELAAFAGIAPDEAVARLDAKGFAVRPDMSLRQIAGADPAGANAVLAALLIPRS
ncbi:DUF4405 domain-containing protein [Frigidibacter oleivorans]|uniref:DUF4405 domain-containing protein n=1 Tax=Frigidibacter oleivorans TaxID=2487129 RepID=UPI000F8F46DF|nr:DUF4405 domain-containing protein [Frigidibacter oleivorans]